MAPLQVFNSRFATFSSLITLFVVSGCSSEAAPRSADPQSCVPQCPSLASAVARIALDTSSCVQFTYPEPVAFPARVQNTCFANGARVEDRRLDEQHYEQRVFVNGSDVPALITVMALDGTTIVDGATNMQLARMSSPDPTHLLVECDGESHLSTLEETAACLPAPSGSGSDSGAAANCSPGVCS